MRFVGRGNPDGEAADPFDADVRVHSGDRAELLCWVLRLESSAISEARTDNPKKAVGLEPHIGSWLAL